MKTIIYCIITFKNILKRRANMEVRVQILKIRKELYHSAFNDTTLFGL